MLAQSIDRMKRQERREGKREGKREGEREAKRKAARKMLADGLPVDKIGSYTGLSVDEILQMKEKP